MKNKAEWIQIATRELLDGASFIDVIGLLECDGLSSREAEEIVELATEELEKS